MANQRSVQKTKARLQRRQSAYDNLPSNIKGGYKRPGSRNRKKGG